MKRRMIDGGVWANDKFARLPFPARLLQMGLINLADDQGRMMAHPSYLRSQIFPYDDEVTGGDIRKWLEAIVANGTVTIYRVDDKEYLQLLNWWDYQSLQYATPSDLPRVDGWQDRVRYNAKGGMTLTCNWITPKGDKPMDTCDQDGNPLPIVADLPPRNPGGRPPENPPVNGRDNPGGNTNKEQIKNNTNQGGDRAREPYRAQSNPGEYLPGLPLPRHRQAKCTADHIARQRDKLGLTPPQLTALTDTVLERMNATQIAALDTDMGNDELRLAQEVALALVGLGHNTPQGIGAVFDAWYIHDWRGKKGESPTYKSILGHARDLPKKLEARKTELPKLSEAEKSKLLTRAKNARASIRTAEQFKGAIEPQWLQDIEVAKEHGLI